jgi:hypothetical protein
MAATNHKIPSFEKVNYLLRPRKQIERKIIIEILQELKPLMTNFNMHEYIGMGSIYYYDFILFHKFLNLENLISIDDKMTEKRFDFNKPYEFITFKNQNSTDFLSGREWEKNSILWMDYDLKIYEVIEDFGILSSRCKENDILIFTIDSQCDFSKEEEDLIFDNLIEYISPSLRHKKYLTSQLYPTLIENICHNYFKERLLYEKVKFNKLFSFTYTDRAKMYTSGGIFSLPQNIPNLINPFIRKNNEIIDIDIPLITYKEKFYLDSKISTLKKEINKLRDELKDNEIEIGSDKEKVFISKKLDLEIELSLQDLKGYIEFYRYYPQYYEGII